MWLTKTFALFESVDLVLHHGFLVVAVGGRVVGGRAVDQLLDLPLEVGRVLDLLLEGGLQVVDLVLEVVEVALAPLGRIQPGLGDVGGLEVRLEVIRRVEGLVALRTDEALLAVLEAALSAILRRRRDRADRGRELGRLEKVEK